MNTEKNTAAVAAAAGVPPQQADALALLLQMMLEKERVGLEKATHDAVQVAAHDAQARLESDAFIQKNVAKQQNCNHLKGGRYRDSSSKLDYHISQHVYIDGSQVVKCLLCSSKWSPTDTAEFFIRDGGKTKVFNWTGSGWRDSLAGRPSVIYMLSHTTNKITRSETASGQTAGVPDAPKRIEGIEKIQF
jgi:hypothetical protein